MKYKIDIVSEVHDWEGLYIDNKLVYESEDPITADKILDVLKIRYTRHKAEPYDFEDFPKSLKDIHLEEI